MKEKYIKEVLEKVKDGGLAVDDAYEQLRDLPFKDIGFANVDNHRAVRTGFPEVVFCQGKTPRQIAQIMAELVKNGGNIMGTRATAEDYKAVKELLSDAEYYETARIIDKLDRIRAADVGIVIAGMEGALASVVGGLVDVPVIAVPTSIGYGANLGGLSALLSMLNSCANGVGVVNIDNGFGAAYLASVINRKR